MMKLYRHLGVLLLSIQIALFLLPMPVLAAGSIDLNQDAGLTISCQDGERSLAGAEFSIYLVATVDEYGELTTTEAFSQYNVDICCKTDAEWRTLASTLEGYVELDHIAATDSGKTDEKGLVSFPTEGNRLTPGLYLVMGQRHCQDGYYYDASPFMVMLPSQDEDAKEWNYNVTCNVKYESSVISEEPGTVSRKVIKVWNDMGNEEDRPQEITVYLLKNGSVYDTVTLSTDNNWRYTWEDLDDSCQWTVAEKDLEGYKVSMAREGETFTVTNTYDGEDTDNSYPVNPLPQTGQFWWPVPVLICAGLIFIVVGLLRRRGGKK